MAELSNEDECVCKSAKQSQVCQVGAPIGSHTHSLIKNADLYNLSHRQRGLKQNHKGRYKLLPICWNTPDVCGFLNL